MYTLPDVCQCHLGKCSMKIENRHFPGDQKFTLKFLFADLIFYICHYFFRTVLRNQLLQIIDCSKAEPIFSLWNQRATSF